MSELRLVSDAWLSARLDKPAFHLVGDISQFNRYEAEFARQLAAPVFADVKIPVADIQKIALAQAYGFMLIDTQLSFSLGDRSLLGKFAPMGSFASPQMAKAIGALAERSFTADRFHRDPKVPRAAADAIKRDWAENFFAGQRGHWMVVASRQNAVIGFLQLLRSPRNELVIDLIAVDAPFQRQGVAAGMISFAAQHCDASGPIIVGTQAANIASVRAYEQLGFRLTGGQYVLHYHGPG